MSITSAHNPDAVPVDAPPPATIPRLIWAVAGLAILVRVIIALATHFTNEDSLITLRFAENIAHGHGFVYNTGEHVLGTTTPLYTLLLAAVEWLGLPAAALGKGANILADGLLCVALHRWLTVAGYERAGRVAALLAALNPIQIAYSISGMETSLVALSGTVVWLLFAQRRISLAYLAAAALFLLRWDSILLTGVLTLAVLFRERAVPWKGLLLYAAVISPWLVWAGWYFGSPIPVTAGAKATVYGWRYRGRFLPLLPKFILSFFGNPATALVTLSAFLGLNLVLRKGRSVLLPPICWFAVYWALFLLSKVLLFPWYYVPPMPVFVAVAAIGITTIASRIGAGWPRTIQVTAAYGLTVLFAVPSLAVCFITRRSEQIMEDNLRKPIGLWLKANSAPGDTIMLEPLGYIGYYSKLRMVDTVGLVAPQVLPYWNARNAYPFVDIAEAFKPDWCVLRPIEAERMIKVSKLAGGRWDTDYELIRTFTFKAGTENSFRIYHRTNPDGNTVKN
jgi:hypothetical protein